jgi:hypothetical protein
MVTVQERPFSPKSLVQECIAACGSHYNDAYFKMLEMPISDLLWHIQQWVEVQQAINKQSSSSQDTVRVTDASDFE